MSDNLEKTLKLEQAEHKDTVYVKCSSCGANMTFDPVTQALKCGHCGSIEDFKKSHKVKELDILDSLKEKENWDSESNVYRCNNCGAVVVLSSHEVANSCPYCGTSHIVKSEELAGLKPNALYPFTVSVEEGVEKAKNWAKKRFFAPKKFKKSLNYENIHGVYEPSFTFDSFTYSTYEGRIGKKHTRVVGSGRNKRTETYIVWRRISGSYAYNFDDVLINSSSSYEQKTLDKLLPFKYETISVYEQKFLTGFMAKRHEKSVNDSWEEAKDVMDAKLKKLILAEYNHDVVDYLNVSTTHERVTYKYVLLPIYNLIFNHKKK
ncbi:MAG: hypothetical protein J6Q38_01070, partial [Clostridia bacterium]|nr:hypothetical protein [Clostridia bacterium]